MTDFLAPATICLLLTRVLNPYLPYIYISLIFHQSHLVDAVTSFSTPGFVFAVVIAIFLPLTAGILTSLLSLTFSLPCCYCPCSPSPKKSPSFSRPFALPSGLGISPLGTIICLDIAGSLVFELSSKLLTRLSYVFLYQLRIVKILDFSYLAQLLA